MNGTVYGNGTETLKNWRRQKIAINENLYNQNRQTKRKFEEIQIYGMQTWAEVAKQN